MVHLAAVRRDSTVPSLTKRVETVTLDEPQEHDFYSSVYGSRFAAEDLPEFEMPEKEMPREVAYRMIKDDLSLDGNPMLKCVLPLAIFVLICQTLSLKVALDGSYRGGLTVGS